MQAVTAMRSPIALIGKHMLTNNNLYVTPDLKNIYFFSTVLQRCHFHTWFMFFQRHHNRHSRTTNHRRQMFTFPEYLVFGRRVLKKKIKIWNWWPGLNMKNCSFRCWHKAVDIDTKYSRRNPTDCAAWKRDRIMYVFYFSFSSHVYYMLLIFTFPW